MEMTEPRRSLIEILAQYDLGATLSKSLFLFLLCYGSVGGFLSAYDMDYNKILCIIIMAILSFLMGFLYELEIKWVTNLAIIVIFAVYALIAVEMFWILNSGAYAVINKMYEVARAYLGITGGNAYSLRIQDAYLTVTSIAIFVGAVEIILVGIRTQYKAGFFSTFLMTFILYLIPLYFDRTPDLPETFCLLSGYATLFLIQCGGSRKHISGQMRKALPLGIALSAAITLLIGALFPQRDYRVLVPKNPQKAAMEDTVAVFAQYGMLAFMRNASGAGVSGGKLSNNAALMPQYKTDLTVRFTPYSMEPLYLKAFAGLDYLGDRWRDVREVFPEADAMLARSSSPSSSVVINRKEWFVSDPGVQSRGVMEVVNVDASEDFDYRPYYADDAATIQIGDTSIYTYYPAVSDVLILDREPDERYLQVPQNCYRAVKKTCEEAGFSGTPEEIARQITDYFAENFTYTLRPGFYFGGQDYISYFLNRNKKGYCSHFASAGTMLFRYMGIPARYVEGYALSYADMALDGTLLEDEKYEDYYSGYSPLGETALVEVDVSDAQAHAWVEIYIEGKGWVVVDPTPATGEEEEVGSFWENFGIGNGSDEGNDSGQDGLTDYLGDALENSAPFLFIAMAAAVLCFLGKKALEKQRERKLPERERAKLEYRRMTERLSEREPEFAALTTPAQELAWIRENFGAEIPEGLEERLYRAFFAPEGQQDCQALRLELAGLRRRIRRGAQKRRKGKAL